MSKKFIIILLNSTLFVTIYGMDTAIDALFREREQTTLQRADHAEALIIDAQNLTDQAINHLDEVRILQQRLRDAEHKMIDRTLIATSVTMVALLVLCATIIERILLIRNRESTPHDKSKENPSINSEAIASAEPTNPSSNTSVDETSLQSNHPAESYPNQTRS